MNIQELRILLKSEWEDIKQEANLHILIAPKAKRTNRYYISTLYHAAIDHLRILMKEPVWVSMELAEEEPARNIIDLQLDVRRAIDKLFNPNEGAETVSYLLGKTNGADLALKYHKSRQAIHVIIQKRTSRLRRELMAYAPPL